MTSIHIPRLDLSMNGVDEATVAQALDALGPALSAARGERGTQPPPTGALRFAAMPSAETLAAGIAQRVAHEVRCATPSSTPRGA